MADQKRSVGRWLAALALTGAGLAVWQSTPADSQRIEKGAPHLRYEIVHVYPHDRHAFTQGLIYKDGFLYEGTGLNGRSSLRKVRLETGEVLQQTPLPEVYFGEGVTDWGDQLLQLTWQNGLGFVYQRQSLLQTQSFRYPGEGWGITHDDQRLFESDGSASLRVWNPVTFQELSRIAVHDGNTPILNLNELEYVQGAILANVWQTDSIVRISPETGAVLAWIDLPRLLQPEDLTEPVDVLNGIAYDAAGDRLFVTGKLWPKLFEIKIHDTVPPPHHRL